VSARPIAAPRRADAIAGLYAITPDLQDTEVLATLVDAALRGGAALVQYRNKSADGDLRRVQALRLAALCASRRRPLIVNDHLELALSIDGAGLHVGADDLATGPPLVELRARLGADRLLGVSCYRSVEAARAAVDAGADYVAFGSVFPSTTKPAAPAATLALFREARSLGVPLVGIGGITRANVDALIAAGCDSVAVIADLFGSADPSQTELHARALARAFP
jgi:thiamine-phosphate pyrophosphorylase